MVSLGPRSPVTGARGVWTRLALGREAGLAARSRGPVSPTAPLPPFLSRGPTSSPREPGGQARLPWRPNTYEGAAHPCPPLVGPVSSSASFSCCNDRFRD